MFIVNTIKFATLKTSRNLFKIYKPNTNSKKSSRSRRVFVYIALTVILYIFYYFGAFTHFFEKDLREFQRTIEIPYEYEIQDIFGKNTNMAKLTFIHKAEHTCDKNKKAPYLTILIKSRITHFENRLVIRNTWAQLDDYGLIKRVFLIGLPNPTDEPLKTSKQTYSQTLELENKKYADIVQQNFYDSYYNNTVKALMGLRWASEYCPQSKYYLFVDDDFYVNPKLMMSYLVQNVTKNIYDTLYAGFVFPNSSPMRHQISKWYISLQDYPYHKFPPYAAAGFYFMSSKSLLLFYKASKMIELFKFDDIYMGILAYKLNIKPTHIENVYFDPPSYYPSIYANEVIAAHKFPASKLVKVWAQLESLIKFRPKSYEDYF